MLATLHCTRIVARDAVELADGRLGAGSPCEPLIACLIEHEIANLNDTEEEHGCAEEHSDQDRQYDHSVSEPCNFTGITNA